MRPVFCFLKSMRPVFAVASFRPSLSLFSCCLSPRPWSYRAPGLGPCMHAQCLTSLALRCKKVILKPGAKKKTTDESYSYCPLFLEMFLTQTEFFVYSPLTVASVLSLKIYRRWHNGWFSLQSAAAKNILRHDGHMWLASIHARAPYKHASISGREFSASAERQNCVHAPLPCLAALQG
jgi:hypothetical protein